MASILEQPLPKKSKTAAALLSHLDQLLEALTKADAESATVKKKTSDLARQLITPAYTAHSDKVRAE